MRIEHFRISDISKRTGIPKDQVCEYARIFDEVLLWWNDGTQTLYTPDALLIINRIDQYVKEGKSPGSESGFERGIASAVKTERNGRKGDRMARG